MKIDVKIFGVEKIKQNLKKANDMAVKATYRTLNDIAFHAKASLAGAHRAWYRGARTSFINYLKRGLLIDKATLAKMHATLGYATNINRIKHFEEGSGTRTPEKATNILIPMNNIRSKPKTLLKQKNVFETDKGIFRRSKRGDIKLLYVKKKTTKYRKKYSSFFSVVNTVYMRNYKRYMQAHLQRSFDKLKG